MKTVSHSWINAFRFNWAGSLKWMLVLFSVVTLASCGKTNTAELPPVDESYWLQKERCVVVYADNFCDYYIVETRSGYTVIQNWGGFTPFVGDWIMGDLTRWGTRQLYNYSSKYQITGNVKEYWMSWFAAREFVAALCR